MSGATVPENIPPIEEWICRPLLCPNDPEWWSLITGVLLQLSYGYYWDKDSGDWEAARYAGRQIMVAWGNQDECSGPLSTEGDLCRDYDLESSIISWAPNDPYRTPNLIPSGYALPPWYKVGVVIPYVGLQPGDIITDLLHSPFNTLASGFPRLRINVSGSGTVELHMLRFPTASIVFITIDDNPTSSRWQDLNSTLSPVGGAFDPVSIIEVEITGSGQHHIDVTIVSSVGESFPFVHFGGGIRKINLCGFDAVSPPTINLPELEYDMSICEQLRWNEGVLEGLCCGEWTPITGATGGIVPSPTQPPGQPRPPESESKCFNVALSANQKWQLPFPVLPGDEVTISNISGTWSDGGLSPWYTPDGHTAIFGVSTGSGQGHAGGDPFATPYHMALVAFTATEDFSATGGPFTIGGSGSQQLTLQANDGTLDDNTGTIAFRICVENGTPPPPTEWCFVFDFTVAEYVWEPAIESGCTEATYNSGDGWARGACREEYVGIILPLFDVSHISTVTIELDTPLTGSDKHIELITNLGESGQQVFDEYGVLTTSHTFEVDQDSVEKFYILTASTDGVPADLNDSLITRVTITGTGTNPFGLTNC